MSSYYCWSNYTYQVNKYIHSMKQNPYLQELQKDIRMDKLRSFHQLFEKPYAEWIKTIVDTHPDKAHAWIDVLYSTYTTDIAIRQFVKKITETIPLGQTQSIFQLMDCHLYASHEDTSSLLSSSKDVDEDRMSQLSTVSSIASGENTEEVLEPFHPTALKFVTNTALSHLHTPIYVLDLYDAFEAPKDIVDLSKSRETETTVYVPGVVGKIIACKVANRPVKGYFKKDSQDNFENCTTVHVVVDENKSINVKIFNNGCMQLTGVRDMDDGKRASYYTISGIRALQEASPRHKIVESLSILQGITQETVSYKTVMMNGCYELGFMVNREALHDLMRKKYNIQSIFDSEGYPGVRIPFYYNEATVGTNYEGICRCHPVCPSPTMEKARKNKEKSKQLSMRKKALNEPTTAETSSISEIIPADRPMCRRIAIMVFQSGSVIISGGCSAVQDRTIYDPYHMAYRFINRLLHRIVSDIRIVGVSKKQKKSSSSASSLKRLTATFQENQK